MKIRDILNTKETYQQIIDARRKVINEDLIEIKDLKEDEQKDIQKYRKPNLEIIKSFEEGIFESLFTIIQCNYSMGASIATIRDVYFETVPYFLIRYKKSSSYVQLIEMLSIGILLGIEQGEFDKLTQCIKQDNPNDFLIDFLIHYRDTTWVRQSSKFMWNKPYKLTQEIIELAQTDKSQALEKLKKYLNEWYKSIEIKTHNNKNIHYGYWCWEAGALAKILGLDDSNLKTQQYYPYDMVHFKD